jgi:formylglycine-generating enzyme required for sulfatase activity
VGVNWDDAQEFCRWLTEKEIAAGKLPKTMRYRLPTDEEWSRAVGLEGEIGATPADKSEKNKVAYPWGVGFPLKRSKFANYSDTTFHEKFPKDGWLQECNDGFVTTSPVGSFPPNPFGLYDMGGNVWQWCEDRIQKESRDRVARGASWQHAGRRMLLSSHRLSSGPNTRANDIGFRCVLGPAVPGNAD